MYICNMFSKLKSYFVIFICGVIAGGAVMWTVMKPPKGTPDEVTVKSISGQPVVHRDFNYKGKDISFITESKGIGISSTHIPKRNMPEARAWMDFVHSISVQGSLMYDYNFGAWETIYQVNYWRRFGRVSLGCGLSAGKHHVGVNIGGMVWF
jgi:hypothetical protein